MSSEDQETVDAQEPGGRAAAVLANYLSRVDAGESPDRGELLTANPDCAAQLRTYFELADRLDRSHSHDTLEQLDGRTLGADTMGLNRSAINRAASRAEPPLTKGATPFGDYELLEAIARGGMGVVYKARQRRLNRVVAVKMILSGQFADQAEVDRFYAEAEAAAALRHPGIVGIHEVGEIQGQHFFSMDFIEGQSLADMVRERPLPPEQAARYVKAVAEAMQYAHDRGILHRDLKPANVLVDRHDQPLVTDFGLSKRVDGGSKLTVTGGIIGTPSYMPPEQAAGRSEDVGPRSDVYALGAVLFQLVTGSPPFRSANVAQTIQLVLHNEPAAPRVLNPNVPRDLETICLKCLQKEPARRYASAQDLADELGRFLAGEPIQARPVGRVERFWRWCRRNPMLAALSASAVSLLVVLLAVSAWYNVQLSRAKAESDAFLAQAEQAVNELFVEVSENTLLNQPGMQPLREKLLRRALAYYQRFLEERKDDPALQDQIAQTHFRIGVITEAIESREKAIESYAKAQRMQLQLVEQTPQDEGRLEALGKTHNALGAAQQRLRRYEEARQSFNAAVDVRRRLAQLEPDVAEHQRTLANSYMNLGLLEQELGDAVEARRQFDVAQQQRRKFLDAGRDSSTMRADLGKGHYNLAILAQAEGDYDTFQREMSSAIEQFEYIERQAPDDLDNQYRLAVCYRLLEPMQATIEDRLATLQQARKRLEPLARRNPTVDDYQFELADLQLTLGEVHRDAGNTSPALAAFQRARDILQPLADKAPASVRFRRELAVALRALAVELVLAGRPAEARAPLQASRSYLEQLVAEHGDESDFRAQLEETQAMIDELDAAASSARRQLDSPAGN